MSDIEQYKISAYVEPYWEDLPIHSLDFARHLKPDVALDKKTVKGDNGRPIRADYYCPSGVKMCEIYWDFTSNTDNIITEKLVYLRYVKNDDTFSDPILIKKKTYNLADLNDGELAFAERIEARDAIFRSLKAFASGVVMQAFQVNQAAAIDMAKPFFDEYDLAIRDFVELGHPEWKDSLTALDLTTTPYTFLAIPITSGVTLRDYIVTRLSY